MKENEKENKAKGYITKTIYNTSLFVIVSFLYLTISFVSLSSSVFP